MHSTSRVLLGLWLLLLSLCTFALPAPGMGYVETVNLDRNTREITVIGWAGPNNTSVFTTNLIVHIAGHEVYRGRMERFERPDVVKHTGRTDWLSSGFRIRIALPDRISPGSHSLTARMRLGDGTEFELGIASTAQLVSVPATSDASPIFARLGLLCAVLGPLLVLISGVLRGRGAPTKSDLDKREPILFSCTVLLSFTLLVGFGWTGSSLPLGLGQFESDIAQHDAIPWIGTLQSVRSDEWSVITPLAIGQKMHQPAFPIINQNLGTDGHNMLIIGMTGVPVMHVSAIARPATWGFFLFDLRRALAWYWWLPFFSCFGAVWLLFLRLFSMDWRLAAGLSLTVAASPYSVVFSGWPAYAVFFPAFGMLAADSAIRTSRTHTATLYGALLGLSIAGFALVLYPAWQISLVYLFLPLSAAHFVAQRSKLRFQIPQAFALIAALLVSSLVLIPWWMDAHDAITSIRATVYPGQRSVEVGGDIDRWFLVKGWLSPITMYRDSSLMVGASDAGSIVFLFFPVMAAVLLRWLKKRQVDAVPAVLCMYIAVALWFLFFGFNTTFARWTLWGSTTSYRFDLALGVAQILLFAWLAAERMTPQVPMPTPFYKSQYMGILVGGLAVFASLAAYRFVPPAINEIVPPSYLLFCLVALGAASYFLVRGHHTACFGVYGSVMLLASIPFNPLSLAPTAINTTPAFSQLISKAQREGAGQYRIAVIGERNWATLLPMVGIPVVNSVFYYPQKTLWNTLDPQGADRILYNRYQRVLFELSPLGDTQSYRIDSPRLDEVRVTLDPKGFNFDLLNAQAVLVNFQSGSALVGNPTLEMTGKDGEWMLFRVIKPKYSR